MSAARVLAAVLRLHAQHGRVTVRDVAFEADVSFGRGVQQPLAQLRDAGLVAWEPGQFATLRPLVTPVWEAQPAPARDPLDVRGLLALWDDEANEGAATGPSATGARP